MIGRKKTKNVFGFYTENGQRINPVKSYKQYLLDAYGPSKIRAVKESTRDIYRRESRGI